jgi:hypothetical protein
MPINPNLKREVKTHEIQVLNFTAIFRFIEGSRKIPTRLHLVAVKEGETARAPTQKDLDNIAAHLKENPAPHEVSLPPTIEEAERRFDEFKSSMKSSAAFYQKKRKL